MTGEAKNLTLERRKGRGGSRMAVGERRGERLSHSRSFKFLWLQFESFSVVSEVDYGGKVVIVKDIVD